MPCKKRIINHWKRRNTTITFGYNEVQIHNPKDFNEKLLYLVRKICKVSRYNTNTKIPTVFNLSTLSEQYQK